MSADIINLRNARKQRDRKVKETKAAENRRKFGRTKSEKILDQLEDRKLVQKLDEHQLQKGKGPSEEND